jgi:hypothetical protein
LVRRLKNVNSSLTLASREPTDSDASQPRSACRDQLLQLVVPLHAVVDRVDGRAVGLGAEKAGSDGVQRRDEIGSRQGVPRVLLEEAEAAVIRDLEELVPVEVVAADRLAEREPPARHEVERQGRGGERTDGLVASQGGHVGNVPAERPPVVPAAAEPERIGRSVPAAAGEPIAGTGLVGHLVEFELLDPQPIGGPARHAHDRRAGDLLDGPRKFLDPQPLARERRPGRTRSGQREDAERVLRLHEFGELDRHDLRLVLVGADGLQQTDDAEETGAEPPRPSRHGELSGVHRHRRRVPENDRPYRPLQSLNFIVIRTTVSAGISV